MEKFPPTFAGAIAAYEDCAGMCQSLAKKDFAAHLVVLSSGGAELVNEVVQAYLTALAEEIHQKAENARARARQHAGADHGAGGRSGAPHSRGGAL